MLYIQKGAAPTEVTRQVIEITKGDEWKNADDNNTTLVRSFFDRLDKQLIRESLIKEQHGLCAYCMKRIEADDKMNIEHFSPVKEDKENALSYKNMLGCCSGGGNEQEKHKILCCDAAKKDRKINIDPRNREMMEKISYRKDGRICVLADERLQYDIDHVLQLNGILDDKGNVKRDTSTQIVMGRRLAYKEYETFMNALEKKFGSNESRIKLCIKKRIEEIENTDTYPEYAGVMLYFMKRRVRR